MGQLKNYLTINAYFSALSGLSMILFSTSLQSIFGFENTLVFPIIGSNLLFFAAFVFYVSHKQLSNKLLVNVISFLDGLWVLGSLLIIGFKLFDLTAMGYAIISSIAIWIGFLGYKQYQYNRLYSK